MFYYIMLCGKAQTICQERNALPSRPSSRFSARTIFRQNGVESEPAYTRFFPATRAR